MARIAEAAQANGMVWSLLSNENGSCKSLRAGGFFAGHNSYEDLKTELSIWMQEHGQKGESLQEKKHTKEVHQKFKITFKRKAGNHSKKKEKKEDKQAEEDSAKKTDKKLKMKEDEQEEKHVEKDPNMSASKHPGNTALKNKPLGKEQSGRSLRSTNKQVQKNEAENKPTGYKAAVKNPMHDKVWTSGDSNDVIDLAFGESEEEWEEPGPDDWSVFKYQGTKKRKYIVNSDDDQPTKKKTSDDHEEAFQPTRKRVKPAFEDFDLEQPKDSKDSDLPAGVYFLQGVHYVVDKNSQGYPEPVSCKIANCKLTFKSVEAFTKHAKKSHAKSYDLEVGVSLEQGIHYDVHGNSEGNLGVVFCKIASCTNTFKSLAALEVHAKRNHGLRPQSDNFAEAKILAAPKKRMSKHKKDGQVVCDSYDVTRGSLRKRWHHLTHIKLKNLQRKARDSVDREKSGSPRPENTPPPFLIILLKYNMTDLGWSAWDSLLNETHFHHMRLMVEECVNYKSVVLGWADKVLKDSRNGKGSLPGMSAHDSDMCIGAAKNLRKTFSESSDGLPDILKDMLQSHREKECKEAVLWLNVQRKILNYDRQYHLDKYLEQAVMKYKKWKEYKKPDSIQKCLKNMIEHYMKNSGMSKEEATVKASQGHPFIDSSEDESHQTYKQRQKSKVWRLVFGDSPNNATSQAFQRPSVNAATPVPPSGHEVTGGGPCKTTHLKVPG